MAISKVGEVIFNLRKRRDWTVKELIERLAEKKQSASAGYITRIEQYGEVPSPEFICALADIFHVNAKKLLSAAKEQKLEQVDRNLEERYQKALGFYRAQKRR